MVPDGFLRCGKEAPFAWSVLWLGSIHIVDGNSQLTLRALDAM